MSNFVVSMAFAVGAVMAAGWAANSIAGFWYTIMSIAMIGLSLLYMAQGIVEIVDDMHYRRRKIHKPYNNTVKSNRKVG